MHSNKTREDSLAWLRANQKSIAPGQAVKIGPFRPEDAEGVARLYYSIYGENFPLDYVYDPAEVAAANAGPDLHHYVARTPYGEIVGITALFRAAPHSGIMESGGLMILPAYRGGSLVVRLTKASLESLPEQLGLNAIFGQSVCDHTITQKLARHCSYTSSALELESMPPRPEDSTDGVGGRISLLNQFRVFHDIPHTVHLPRRHEEFLRNLYARLGLKRDFAPGLPSWGQTRHSTSVMSKASLAKLLVTEPGTDLGDIIGIFETDNPDYHVYHLLLPLAHPGLPAAVETAREHGYFFAGMLPLWIETDVLLLQKLSAPPDFSLPKMLTDDSAEMLAYIVQDWHSLSG